MKSQTSVRLTYDQTEEITITTLTEYHHDLKTALSMGLHMADQVDVLRSLVAIETILRDFQTESDYIKWKEEYGVDL
jgi:hypothetical protein